MGVPGMSATYTIADYDSSVLPGGLHKDVGLMVHGALAVGWKLRVKGMIIRLISPNGQKTITVSASNKNIPYARYKKMISEHANPLLVPATDERAMDYADTMIQHERQVAKKREEERVGTQIETAMMEAVEKVEEVSSRKPTRPPLKERTQATRYVESETQMMAHRGQRRGYLSPTTNERKWSDGTVDFTCRSEGCDFSSESRGGISRHWRSHVSRGEEQAGLTSEQTYVTPPHEPIYNMSYTPRRERVNALSAVLAALDLNAMTAEELAEFVLNWQHEQSESGSRMAAEREEMTDGDILLRIRSLLDNGTYLNQQEEIENLKVQVADLDQAKCEAVATAQAAQERWTTLRSLMDED